MKTKNGPANNFAVIYKRVSTEGQADDGTSLETQEADCRELAAQQGLDVFEVAQDARSGAILERRGLDRVRALVETRQVGHVICWDVDRLTRGGPVHLAILLDEFYKYGAKVWFVKAPPRANTDEDELFQDIRGAFGKYERTKIKDRLRRGKQRRSEQGRVIPGPRVAYGYRYIKVDKAKGTGGEYVIVPSQAEVVVSIFQWFVVQCMSLDQIALKLNAEGIPSPGGSRWNRQGAYRVVTNRVYTGTYLWGKWESYEPAPGQAKKDVRDRARIKSCARRRDDADCIPVTGPAVPQFLPQDLYDRAQERLRNGQANNPRKEKHQYLLRSLVFCARCGRRYAGQCTHGRRVYVCSGKCQGWMPHAERCKAREYGADVLERAVWDAIRTRLKDPDALQAGMSDQEREHEKRLYDARRLGLYESRAKIAKEQARMKKAYKEGVLSLREWGQEKAEAEERLEAITTELERLEAEHERRMASALTDEQVALMRAWLANEGLIQPTYEEKRRLLEKLQVRITADGRSVVVQAKVTGALVADLENAQEQLQFERRAMADLRAKIAALRAEGTMAPEEAEDALASIESAHAAGMLTLSRNLDGPPPEPSQELLEQWANEPESEYPDPLPECRVVGVGFTHQSSR